MTGHRTYLDHNATAPLRAEARSAMLGVLDVMGNPSSVHGDGRRARAIIDEARAAVARLINAKPAEVVFTSGATEANAWALSGVASGVWSELLVGATEHQSVLAPAEVFSSRCGRSSTIVPVSADGRAALEEIDIQPGARRLLALQIANNETGVLQDVAGAAKTGAERGFSVHADGAQALGRVAVDFRQLGAATLSLSAHKMGGPKGIGALVIRDGVSLPPLIAGGGQERRRRGGTENTLAIAGFGAAATAALRDLGQMERVARLRDAFEREVIRITPDAVMIGAGVPRLANTCCFALPGRSAETLVIKLDLAGIAVSAGAACSSGKVGQSHVLMAMGLDTEVARGAIRVSFSTDTTEQDIAAFLEAWRDIAKASRAAA